MAETSSGLLYLDELPEERMGGSYPALKVIDLTSDGILCLQDFIYPVEGGKALCM